MEKMKATADKKLVVMISKLDLDLEMVKMALEESNLCNSAVQLSRTRNSKAPKKTFGNITVMSVAVDENVSGNNKLTEHTVTAEVVELGKSVRRQKRQGQQHTIVMKFKGNRQFFSSVSCIKCTVEKECSAIPTFLSLVQHHQQLQNVPPPAENDQNSSVTVGHTSKKRLVNRELRVLLQRLDLNKQLLAVPAATADPPLPSVLKKVQKQPGLITPEQVERARQLSMVQLIRDFSGDSVDEFLRFCTERMAGADGDVCDSIPLLTIEQADTDLWHELRIGRITASRMHEASRCTMLNGSLKNKVMGVSSGFSMAMKRGTDLEGHVLAELRKQYPGLRDTGLILDPACPWMGASPDGICDEFVLEIKCPYTERTHECYVDVAKLSPKYFAQIQLQMHVTHRPKALLAVAALDFETTRHITQIWIDYDRAYVEEVMEQAYEFWCKAIFKALLKKRSSKK
uniref:YqaJ domain-containing protein n=1 Tax=Anopheles merus TaxID=30066 RepID=A0A182VDT4_ANOME